MLYERSADLVAITHVAFIAFLFVGGYAAWRFPRLLWVHIPAVVFTAAIFAFGADCPLTDLEKYLRHQAGNRHTGAASSRTICCQWCPTAPAPSRCPWSSSW